MSTSNKQLRVTEYLTSFFAELQEYLPSDDEKKLISRDVQSFTIQKLFRKKYRKQKLHPSTIEEITKKIAASYADHKPFHFTIPWGGYKHFWNPSHPEPDWAEVFTLRFLTEWVAPVLSVYKPGVIFEFISEDMILPRMNNYPDEVLEQYAKGFSHLLETYRKNVPKNLEIRYFRVGEKYDKEKMVQEVERALPKSWENWDTYTHEQKEIELKRSRRSVMWKGREDLTGLSDSEKEKRMIESRLIELAYYDVEAKPEFLGNYFSVDNHIGICFSFGLSPDNVDHWITLGSTYASSVDYWIGRGILEERDDSFMPRIVSKEQYEKIKENKETLEVTFEPLPFKNFQTIDIITAKNWENTL